MNIFQSFTPRSSKRNLLFIVAFVWTFAGGMLLTRGIMMLAIDRDFLLTRLIISIIGGFLFFRYMFSKISKKHVERIIGLKMVRPCTFSFFNVRSYIMMTLMISMGVFLRKSGVVPPFYLSVLYVTMGIPLFMSAFRFYHSGFYYQSIVRKNQ